MNAPAQLFASRTDEGPWNPGTCTMDRLYREVQALLREGLNLTDQFSLEKAEPSVLYEETQHMILGLLGFADTGLTVAERALRAA